jgi:hypothetical protein
METIKAPLLFGMIILYVGAYWQVFSKAGRPGWAILVPFYNLYVLLDIAGKPGWWLILMFIPVVNIVFIIFMFIGLSEAFGKGTGFTIGLVMLPFIFVPILGFGSSTYGYFNDGLGQVIMDNEQSSIVSGSPLRFNR